MRIISAAGTLPMPSSLSLSWPEPSAGFLALSGLLHASEPLDPCPSLPYYKGCKAYKDGWSKLDDAPLTSLLPQSQSLSLLTTMETSDGIEKLVDELCAKLKQIQGGETEARQTPRPNFALVLRDMHNAHYSGYPSLVAECRGADFADSWSDDCYGSDGWLISETNQLACQIQQKKQWQQSKTVASHSKGDQNAEDEFLRVLAENQHNALTLLQDDDDLDLFLDKSNNDTDPSLARLIAKFDSTVEALWSPDILETKSPQVEPLTFISSGTNLTSSIWSDTVANDKEPSRSSLPMEVQKVVGERSKGVWADPKDDDEQIRHAWDNEDNTAVETSWQIGYGLGILSQQILDGENELQQNSLNLINHHREKSGFTEVKKSSLSKTSWSSTDHQTVLNIATTVESSTDTCQEEEDLLTSAKTHFRPIKQNSQDNNTSSSQDTVRYEDGTTFAISSSLDKPPFTRSSSGCFYLNSSDSPKKYKLYTEKEPYNGLYNTGGFIPKYAVIEPQEKGIQTNRDTEDSDSEEDKGFYFPEDEGNFADNIDCPADIEDEGEDDDESTSDTDDVSITWKDKQSPWAEEERSNIPTWRDSKWCEDAEDCQQEENSDSSWFRHIWHKGEEEQICKPSSARLRAELTAEGEQLFADLQYLQTVFLGDCWTAQPLEDDEDSSDDNTKGTSPSIEHSTVLSEWRQKGVRTQDENTEATSTFFSRSACPNTSSWESGTVLHQPGL